MVEWMGQTFSLVSRKFLAMRNIALYSVFYTKDAVECLLCMDAWLEAALLGPLVPTRYSNFRLFTLVVPLTGTGL